MSATFKIGRFITPGHKNACQSIAITYGGANAAKPQLRSWTCTLRRGHDGPHGTRGGHRHWESSTQGYCAPFFEKWPLLTSNKLTELNYPE